MNLSTWYDTGTASVATGSAIVTGFNNFWGADAIMAGDLFCDPAQPLVPPQRVKSAKAGELELWAPWPGAPLVQAAYEIRYVGIIERSTAQTRKVLEELGQVNAWYDIIVEDDTDRLALETASSPLRANYRVLVRTPGVIWAKKSGAFGDWIGPVEFKGDTGEKGWSPVYALVATGARRVEQLVLWVGGTGDAPTYGIGKYRGAIGLVDGIADATDVRGAPGQDGTGTGDFVGPAGGVADGDLVAFADATGKRGKKAGPVSNSQLATVPTATFKGRSAAGTGAPGDLTPLEALTLLKLAGAYAKDNILGPVSQVAGVPTGGVIERGSNSSGFYTRFADGTQICWMLDLGFGAITTAAGALYSGAAEQTFSYPAAFKDTLSVGAFAFSDSTNIFATTFVPSNSAVRVNLFSWTAIASARRVNIVAKGKWF